jgi:hypothetical protein
MSKQPQENLGGTKGISGATSESAINAACSPATPENKTMQVQALPAQQLAAEQRRPDAIAEIPGAAGVRRFKILLASKLAVNAALATERNTGWNEGREHERKCNDAALADAKDYACACESQSNKRGAEVIRLGQQLAAEREKAELLGEALRQIATVEANDEDENTAGFRQTVSYNIAVGALAKVKEGK